MLSKILCLLLSLTVALHCASAAKIVICRNNDLTGCSENDGNKGDCRGLTDGTVAMLSASLTPSGSVLFYSDVGCPNGKELYRFDLAQTGNSFVDQNGNPLPLKLKSVKFL
jgi:hypothetical protein